MGEFLPVETLENVRDLSLEIFCEDAAEHWPQWPDAWNQLTSLTRLEISVFFHDPSFYPHVHTTHELFPIDIKSLVEVTLTANDEWLNGAGYD